MRKRGRPQAENGKNIMFKFRLSDDENDILSALADKNGASKADILRKGLRIQYELYQIQAN